MNRERVAEEIEKEGYCLRHAQRVRDQIQKGTHFFFFCLFRATPTAYEGSQARS